MGSIRVIVINPCWFSGVCFHLALPIRYLDKLEEEKSHVLGHVFYFYTVKHITQIKYIVSALKSHSPHSIQYQLKNYFH